MKNSAQFHNKKKFKQNRPNHQLGIGENLKRSKKSSTVEKGKSLLSCSERKERPDGERWTNRRRLGRPVWFDLVDAHPSESEL